MKTKGQLKGIAKSYLDKADSFISAKLNSNYKVLGLGVLIGILISISLATTLSILFLVGVAVSCIYLLAPNDEIEDGGDEYTDFTAQEDTDKSPEGKDDDDTIKY